MRTVKRTLKSGNTVHLPMLDDLTAVASEHDGMGLCLACGEDAFEVEPDARRYKCESCGQPRVYGLEEIMIRRWYVE